MVRFTAAEKGTAGRNPIVGDEALNYRRAKRMFGAKFANEKYPQFAKKKK
ncbi:MAG: hypothetical protein WC389_19860 [Lutibacter sp.]|jgi:hypothetical protein